MIIPVPIITNQRLSPYFRGTNDIIQTKIYIYNKNKLLNIEGLPIELWLNYSGTWFEAENGFSNRYGSQTMSHSCYNVGNIDCCMGYVKVIYNEIEYISNVVRFNFIENRAYTNVYVINGGTCEEQLTPLNRSTYDIFNGGLNDPYRENFINIDRMFEG